MFSFKVLLLVLALLAVTVQSWSDGNLSEEELKRLYNSPVKTVEYMVEAQDSNSSSLNPISRKVVRVTLDSDLSQWLILRGEDSKIVVTSARNMTSNWQTSVTGDVNGRHTVAAYKEHAELFLK